jgi:hypothetical protein
MRRIIRLDHDTDPRYLIVDDLPERVTIDDLADQRYGKLLTFAPEDEQIVYKQPNGPFTAWVKPKEA